MQQIENAILEVREQIIEERSLYLSNEQAVRAQLIEPILNSLGWKTYSNKFVRHNAQNGDGKIPDYTLLKDTKNILIVEAKNLSVSLTDPKVISQLSGYCYSQGVDFGILTNGARWLLFNTFQRNPLDRIVWEIDLEKESIETVSRKLSSFAYENVTTLDKLINAGKALEVHWERIAGSKDIIVSIIIEKLLNSLKSEDSTLKIDSGEVNAFVINKLNSYFDSEEGEIEKFSAENTNEGKNSLSEVRENVLRGNTKLREKIVVQFPDGTVFKSHNVTVTFINTIEKIGVGRVNNLKIGRGTIDLVSLEKYSGKADYRQHPIGQYWVFTTLSTPDKFSVLKEINEKLQLGLRLNTEWK